MKGGLWVAQVAMGLFFLYVGILHFIVPEGLPATFDWMYELSDTLHFVSGTAEILGGLGLILPAVTRIQPQLVPLAAGGLVLVMLGATAATRARPVIAKITPTVWRRPNLRRVAMTSPSALTSVVVVVMSPPIRPRTRRCGGHRRRAAETDTGRWRRRRRTTTPSPG